MKKYISIFFALLYCKCYQAFTTNNILMIVADDLRPTIRAYGFEGIHTPNIDRLAKDGIIFHKAYVQQALCAPSRNSFLTSRRPDTLHLYDFYNYWRTFAGNFTTLPQFFKENNYHTQSIGKIFHPGASSNFTDDYPLSWSEPAWHPSTEIFKDSNVCPTENGWFANLICPVKVKEQPEKTLPDLQSIEKAVKYLESRKNLSSPFFLAVGLHKPHIPFKFPKHFADKYPLQNISLPGLRNYPPGLPTIAWNPWTDIRKRDDIMKLNISFPYGPFPDFWARKIRQAYFSSVSYIDELIGKLLTSLKMYDLHKKTIVVFLGDNGWSLGEHGTWSKYSTFDVAVRVPLILRIPGVTYGAKRPEKRELHVEEPVELVDLFPTLVDLTGLKPLPKCPQDSAGVTLCTEGESMLALILNKVNEEKTTLKNNSSLTWKAYALSQYPRPDVLPILSPNSDKPKLNQIKFMGYSIRTEKHRYTEWIQWDVKSLKGNWSNVVAKELYDHNFDPDENLNLAGRPGLTELEKNLSNLLRKETKKKGAEKRNTKLYTQS